ncbi:MAG: hypothetical protein COW88_02230 [Candidatus Lloydbacteria bacterium CG22_combo_CG10-13_8_21_14_all_47_15]|uniref:Uncharacterized protein n=1 Tax=Candidatus Lloydbacteria bacterium CG22_combo_CG10-13_8_21_14_all_47_15 TaxID=1974635 RepID=A0A2H0CU10_9BACT|nr:MAG: hypothetical protein COW88_02230 [Candidatus Lloydbacteria bacterium CG22_combo_CG10-13_8_21_14_all_47_15]
MGFETGQSVNQHEIPAFRPEDIDEAREYILARYEKGERPVVTVKKRYLSVLSRGLAPHATWVPEAGDMLVGTFGREALLPEGEERVAVHVLDIDPRHIEPRFTGPDNAFHGVVALSGPIPPERLGF